MTNQTILKFGAIEHAEAGDLPGWIVVEGHPTMQTASSTRRRTAR